MSSLIPYLTMTVGTAVACYMLGQRQALAARPNPSSNTPERRSGTLSSVCRADRRRPNHRYTSRRGGPSNDASDTTESGSLKRKTPPTSRRIATVDGIRGDGGNERKRRHVSVESGMTGAQSTSSTRQNDMDSMDTTPDNGPSLPKTSSLPYDSLSKSSEYPSSAPTEESEMQTSGLALGYRGPSEIAEDHVLRPPSRNCPPRAVSRATPADFVQGSSHSRRASRTPSAASLPPRHRRRVEKNARAATKREMLRQRLARSPDASGSPMAAQRAIRLPPLREVIQGSPTLAPGEADAARAFMCPGAHSIPALRLPPLVTYLFDSASAYRLPAPQGCTPLRGISQQQEWGSGGEHSATPAYGLDSTPRPLPRRSLLFEALARPAQGFAPLGEEIPHPLRRMQDWADAQQDAGESTGHSKGEPVEEGYQAVPCTSQSPPNPDSPVYRPRSPVYPPPTDSVPHLGDHLPAYISLPLAVTPHRPPRKPH